MKDNPMRHNQEGWHQNGRHGQRMGHFGHNFGHHDLRMDDEGHRGHRGGGPWGGHGRHGGEHEEGRGGGGPFGGHRGRARRGEARYVLLDALRDGPKHGYEIIKFLEERSSGEYAPSPGTVYPTMQYLEDLGFVRSEQSAERRVYYITEAGQAELIARADELSSFWARFGNQARASASQPEIAFLREEMDDLGKTVWNGLRGIADRDDPATVRLVRQAVERCRSEIRGIIAQSVSQTDAP